MRRIGGTLLSCATAVNLLVLSIFTIAAGQNRIACVGNSITAGSGLSYNQKWPSQLQVFLGDNYRVKNCGHSMRAALKKSDYPYGESPWFDSVFAFRPDTILMLLGTNDSKSVNWEYGSEFTGDYNALIDTFLTIESSPQIILMVPPPIASDQWGLQKAVIDTAIVPAISEIAEQRDLPLIDIYTLFIGHTDTWLRDGVHPTPEGATYIAHKTYETLITTPLKRGSVSVMSGAAERGNEYRIVVGVNFYGLPLKSGLSGTGYNLMGERVPSYFSNAAIMIMRDEQYGK
ncbi:MAG: sialate O-acetylesterase [Chitinivibrionales bacterium]|nr:sialate O-acetylesterase [Chitinivibrionales bacterium]